jgi:hypothetical protein
MKRVQAVILAIVLCVLSASPGAAAIYKYVDKNGTPSFVDSLDAVPEKYRKDAVRVSGRTEGQEKQSGKEAKPETPDEGKTEKESFINRAKEYAGSLWANGTAVFLAVLAGFIVLFVAFGKIAESLGQKWLGAALRLVLTAGLLVYFFISYSKEVGTLFGKAKDLKEEMQGIKSKAEERNKVLEDLGTEPAKDRKTQE